MKLQFGMSFDPFARGEKLDLSHTFVFTSQIRRREPGGESVSALLHSRALTEFSGIKPKGWYAAEVLWK